MIKTRLTIGIVLITLLTGCNKDVPPPDNQQDNGEYFRLEYQKSFPVTVAEPSGLCIDYTTGQLLVVDDNTNRVYRMNTDGSVSDTLPYQGDDLEGVVMMPDSTIFVAEERKYNLVHLSADGRETERYIVTLGLPSSNHGLEGLSYDKTNSRFVILNEREPGILCYWTSANGVLSRKELEFALDYSGVFADDDGSHLWIVSDQSEKLFYCDNTGKVLQSFDLDFPKAEGIVVDLAQQRLFIVSDSEQKIYHYKITRL